MNIDLDFTDVSFSSTSILNTNRCAYCDGNIHSMPFEATDVNGECLDFCDIICAKLYNDNVSTIKSFNKKIYDDYIRNNVLRNSSKKMYTILNYIDFNFLPISKNITNKHDYIKILFSYYSK